MQVSKTKNKSRTSANTMRRLQGNVGAFGERAVEAELLRNGWSPANFNDTARNAKDYDVVAQKNGKVVLVRIKTCSGQKSFQFRDFVDRLPPNDFTILVEMGERRELDRFFIVPTSDIRKEVSQRKKKVLAQPTRDGRTRKNIGMCVLHLKARKDGRKVPGWDIATKFGDYLDTWTILERPASRSQKW